MKFPRHPNLDRYIEFLAKHKGNIYKELYKLGYDPEDYIALFQTGPLADSWDTGLHYFINFPAERSALMFVCDLRDYFNIDVKHWDSKTYKRGWMLPTSPDQYELSALEWIGQTYEMWSKYSGLSSREVYHKLNFRDMYPAYISSRYDDTYNFMLRISRAPEEFKVASTDPSQENAFQEL